MAGEPPGRGGSVKVLITGGAGYIGSTVASACLDAGITPVILDSLVTGRREFAAAAPFYEGDIADGARGRRDLRGSTRRSARWCTARR